MFNFNTRTLNSLPEAERIQSILNTALQAVEPGGAIWRTVSRSGNLLNLTGSEYDLAQYEGVRLIAFGKAAVPMAGCLANLLKDELTDGLVISQSNKADLPKNLRCLQSSHPVPDERSLQAGMAVLEYLQGVAPQDLLICAISGGGSAMLAAPEPGISLGDLQTITSQLLASGASIDEINTIRKHLDQLKGGGILQRANGATTASLIISDVVGDRLDVIASGPTVPDPTTFSDAWDVVEKFGLSETIPGSIRERLRHGVSGSLMETLKPGSLILDNVRNKIIASNQHAATAALRQAMNEGFTAAILTTHLQGEASQAGRYMAAIARQMALSNQPLPRPACLIVGGETTVTLTAPGETIDHSTRSNGSASRTKSVSASRTKPGSASRTSSGGGPRISTGGRNQEMALAAVREMAGLEQTLLITLATDGRDGPTDAAGAVVSGQTLARSLEAGLDASDSLKRHDSYHFFQHLGDLLQPGLTQTNVNDLALVFTL